jgi:hypothetical protein
LISREKVMAGIEIKQGAGWASDTEICRNTRRLTFPAKKTVSNGCIDQVAFAEEEIILRLHDRSDTGRLFEMAF